MACIPGTVEPQSVREEVQQEVAQSSWQNFLQYFSFAELCGIAELFYEKVWIEEDPAAIRGLDALRVVEGWIYERWNPPNVIVPKSKRFKFRPEDVFKMKMGGDYPEDSEDNNWEFRHVVRFAYHMQALYLGEVPGAGFNQDEIWAFKSIFSNFDTGRGLYARLLFDALGELGFHFTTMLQQNIVVDLVKQVDVDKSGTIDFNEFVHMLRVLYDREEVAKRRRQHALFIRSGMAFTECQNWLEVFQSCEQESDAGIAMGDVKDLFDKIEMTWNCSENRLLTKWLQECDEDCDGQIDFGEFCCLVQRMWDTNFANVQTKTAEALLTTRKLHRRPSNMDPTKMFPATWTAQMTSDAEKQVNQIFGSMAEMAQSSRSCSSALREQIKELEAVLKRPDSDSDEDSCS